ncbi:MAG TPA: thiamine pyrophosphate-dependent enzyme [Stellaceae bacterium]|nr:thiamine pyrophosphate-dependent enzyme [Stellaceae bacterium]
MKYIDAFRALNRHRTDQIVIASAGHSCQAWWEASKDSTTTFYLGASMSMSTMFAAGLAVAQPKLKLWAFMGDGAFCMNPGTLMVERQMNLPNLMHILVSNRAYGGTLNADLPNSARNDYAAIARGMGIERVFTLNTIDEIETEFPAIAQPNVPAYTFVILEVEPLVEQFKSPAIDLEAVELKYRFGRHIEQITGANIFGFRL